MPKKVKALSALEVGRLTKPGFHAVGEVPGLYLQVTPPAARSWVLRVSVGDKRRDMGLGGYPDVTLAQAREKARQAREAIRQGVDPVLQARAARSALKAEQAKAITFKQAATAYIEAHGAGWRNTKHSQQWTNTLTAYAYPVMGALHVRDVELGHVMKVLEPIWREKTETANRLRNRIELVLDWATARGLREGANPARWRGHLDKLLPAPSKVQKTAHQPALSVADMGAFMSRLREAEGMGARCMEFVILTACRSGEARAATWDEIDLEAKIWTVPGSRMKAGREHRVPLSEAAVKLLQALPKMADTNLVFPAPRGGTLSDMTLTAALKRIDEADGGRWKDPRNGRRIVVHGFRSTFRDWAGERTRHPREVVEHALAHRVGDAAERAYARGDLFDKRRRLMTDWAHFVSRIEPRVEGRIYVIGSVVV